MTGRINHGERVPSVTLARLEAGAIKRVDFALLLAGKRALVVGVPGAFTPVCTNAHVPELVGNAPKLRGAGFDLVICVSADNPWVLDAWSAQVDPFHQLLFLSDGNLALARGLGANIVDHDHFLGECSARYMLITRQGLVERFTMETSIGDLTCTRAEDALELD